MLDSGFSLGFKVAKVKTVDETKETVSLHFYRQRRDGSWVLRESNRKDATAENVHFRDILYGPFVLRDDGTVKKKTRLTIVERVEQEQRLQQNPQPISRRRLRRKPK